MKQQFEVAGSTGNNYIVTINITDDDKLTAGCTCQAGMNGTLCKHLMSVISDNPELEELLKKQNYYRLYEEYLRVYDEYLEQKAIAEKIKKKAAAIKKNFAHSILKE